MKARKARTGTDGGCWRHGVGQTTDLRCERKIRSSEGDETRQGMLRRGDRRIRVGPALIKAGRPRTGMVNVLFFDGT